MLEDFAIAVANQDETLLTGVGIALYVLGFALAQWFRRKSDWSLRRVPYFVSMGFVVLAASLLPLGWLLSVEAILSGTLWLLMLGIFSGVIISGFAYGAFCRARAVNGYRDGNLAWLGALPLINLVLLFKAPIQGNTEQSAKRVVGNILGIAFGFLLLASGQVITKEAEDALDQEAARGLEDSDARRISAEALLRVERLENVLQKVAAEIPSQKIDGITSLKGARADGNTLIYEYEISSDVNGLSDVLHRNLIEGNCRPDILGPFLKAGAIVEHRYERTDGSLIRTFQITQDLCDNPPESTEAKNEVPTVDDIEEMVKGSVVEGMYNGLKSYFPEEAKFFREQMALVVGQSASADEASAKMMSVGADIRRRLAPHLAQAPAPMLDQVLMAQVQFIKAFDDDPKMCNQVIMYGPSAIPHEGVEDAMNILGNAAVVLFRAMYEGKNFPVQREAASEDDWLRIFEDFYNAGGTDAELDLVLEPDIQNPALCGGMLRFLDAALYADFPGADRVKAEMVTAMNEG